MSNTPWFRFYNETINDLKIQRAADIADQQKALVIGVWAAILAMASDSPERGRLLIGDDMPVTLREILRFSGIETEPGKAIIAAMLEVGILSLDGDTYVVTNWDSRQFSSDSSKERVRQYRERQKHKDTEIEPKSPESSDDSPHNHHNGAVTEDKPAGYVKRDGNVTVTVQESESESDKQPTITTTPAHAPDDRTDGFRVANNEPPPGARIDDQYSRVSQTYFANIGFMSPIIAQEFGLVYDGISPPVGETKEDWFNYAITQACSKSETKSWSFVRVVIEGNIKTKGIKQHGSLAAHKAVWESKLTGGNPNGRANSQDRQSGRSQAAAKRIPASDGLSRLAAIASGE